MDLPALDRIGFGIVRPPSPPFEMDLGLVSATVFGERNEVITDQVPNTTK